MSLPAAASGFVVLLLFLPVVQGQSGWGVTFTSTQICALKGSTVEMSCNYKHPTNMYGNELTVQETFWFTTDLVDLKTDEAYTDRVEYSCLEKRCTLRIRDLRENDSAVYRFRFITNPREGRYSSPAGVILSVTDPHLNMQSSYSYGTCRSGCRLPDHLTYVWYKNGRDIGIATPSHSGDFQDGDSISCALRGYEDFPSASVCVHDESCNKVNYNDRRICAVRGSSVDISCTYQSYGSVTSKFWFSPQQSHRWSSSSKPEDIKEDSQYASRVQVYGWKRYSTLTIRELRETDSAEYRFKFKTYGDEWGSDLHGTTLTVTEHLALQVHVTRIPTYQHYIRLQLKCLSSCIPSGDSYVWFKNGWRMKVVASSFEDRFDLRDRISCALKTHEQHRSPEVYAPKFPSMSVSSSGEIMDGSSVTLTCSSDANPAANHTWYKRNGNPALQSLSNKSQLIFSSIQSSDSGLYYCTVENALGKRTSGDIGVDVKYAPRPPSLSVSPSAGIMEGSSVNLTCSSDANPAATCTWYKENQTLLQGQKGIFQFTSIQSEDSGTYYCRCENKYGFNFTPAFIDVQYAPKLPSVSLSPSVEIVEGSSVNLTCSSDANPVANYTWYKENQTLLQGQKDVFYFTSIRSEDRGTYYCRCENTYGQIKFIPVFIEVQYAPKLPSVSVSPSAEIMEGSSVNLTCSSDANPAATYTWYKENEDSPTASGQTFTITNATPKHSGKYYCEVRNIRGHHNSSLDLIIVPGPLKSVAIGSITVIVLAVVFLSAFLLIRRQWSLKKILESRENPDNTAQDVDPQYDNPSTAVKREPTEQQDDLYYSSVHFCKKQEDPLYSNIMPARPNKQNEEEEEEEDVEYTAVSFNNSSPGRRCQEVVENPPAVYSTVNKNRRL